LRRCTLERSLLISSFLASPQIPFCIPFSPNDCS
jgi:hypothetical protein